MEATGTQPKQNLPPASFGGALLMALPLDVLELICSSLTLEDRVALTSCCRRFWARPDVTNSTVLWGDIHATVLLHKDADRNVSLGHWLARHKAAVDRLSVHGFRDGIDPAVMLAGLEGGTLAALKFRCFDAIGANPAKALAPLAHLGGLTKLELRWCGVKRLPPQLSALTALKVLDLEENRELGEGQQAGFAPLAAVRQLTALLLKHCELRRLPRQLTALSSSLQVLDLADNHPDLGAAGSMRPLSSLTALTTLDMKNCGLPCIPPQLSAMGSLQQLILNSNNMAQTRKKAWEPLRQLTCLTFLDLFECELELLPPQLSCLTALAELNLSGNWRLGPFFDRRGPAAARGQPARAETSKWQPLLSLGTSLTSLDLSGCSIAALPAGFTSMSALVNLDLSRNEELGFDADTALQPLSGLVALEVLALNSVELARIPPQLKVLPALAELQLWGNTALGELGAALGQQLMELPAVKYLDLNGGIHLDPSTEEMLKDKVFIYEY